MYNNNLEVKQQSKRKNYEKYIIFTCCFIFIKNKQLIINGQENIAKINFLYEKKKKKLG